jgi:sugar transferase (PEP-CTERM/EpsH1 system associated)
VKILFVCHRLPYPPKRGGKIRPFNIVKHFTEAGHRVTVASLARSAKEADEGRDLRKYCAETIVEVIGDWPARLRMVARLPTSAPSSFGYFYSPQLERRVQSALAGESFDMIMVHCSSVAPYVANVTGVAKVLDFGDMDSQKWLLYARHRRLPLAAGYWLEGRKLERTERRLATQFDLCTCTTLAEHDTLRDYDTGAATDWFPNGVDATFFAPTNDDYDRNTICFVGRMDYFPNEQGVLWFCREVMPLVHARRPNARLLVVGAAPPRSILALHGHGGVEVTGTVDDVRPFARRAALTVAPLLIARGTQNKILESLAMGVPVVASVEAARGVDAEPGAHLLTGADGAEFAAAVLRILDDPAERRRFAEAGRERVLARHSWPASLERLDGMLARHLGSRPRPRGEALANALP